MTRSATAQRSPAASSGITYLRDVREERTSDAVLVERACAGNMAAKEGLYARHARVAFGVAHRVLGGDEVDDVVQDAFVVAFERLHQLRDGQAFAAWLISIVVAQARSRLRKRKLLGRFGFGRREAYDFDALASRIGPPDVMAELGALYAVLDELPVEVRIALVMRRVEGLTVREIAVAMDVSESTAKRHVQAGEVLLEARLSRGETP